MFAFQYMNCCLRDRSQDHMALIASGACFHESHMTVANREAVLNGYSSIRFTIPPSYIPRPSTEGTCKNPHLPVSPWKVPDAA